MILIMQNDFWFFKDHVRCILLHTKLGNTFGSAYKPVGRITKTAGKRNSIILSNY